MYAEEAKALLKDRGVPVVNMPHGYIVTMSASILRYLSLLLTNLVLKYHFMTL